MSTSALCVFSGLMSLSAVLQVYLNKRLASYRRDAKKPPRTVKETVRLIFGDSIIFIGLPLIRTDPYV